jgi:hypothetical protein
MPHPGKTGRRPRRIDRDQLRRDVLRGLVEGLPLSVIARRNGTTQQLVSKWETRDPAFAEEIAEARALGWDSLAVECLTIIDDRSHDVAYDSEGVPHPNSAAVLRAKAMCDVRLKLLAVWDSGRYGAAKTLKVEGEITHTQRHVLDPRQMDEAGREALRALLTHAQAQGLIANSLPDSDEVIDAEWEEGEGEDDLQT